MATTIGLVLTSHLMSMNELLGQLKDGEIDRRVALLSEKKQVNHSLALHYHYLMYLRSRGRCY